MAFVVELVVDMLVVVGEHRLAGFGPGSWVLSHVRIHIV